MQKLSQERFGTYSYGTGEEAMEDMADVLILLREALQEAADAVEDAADELGRIMKSSEKEGCISFRKHEQG